MRRKRMKKGIFHIKKIGRRLSTGEEAGFQKFLLDEDLVDCFYGHYFGP